MLPPFEPRPTYRDADRRLHDRTRCICDFCIDWRAEMREDARPQPTE